MIVFSQDGCTSEPTVFSNSLMWPETDLGQTVTISCPCGDLSLGVGHPSAQRLCNGSFTSRAWRMIVVVTLPNDPLQTVPPQPTAVYQLHYIWLV